MITWLIIIGSVYILLCILFYFGQHFFFFRPEILPVHFEYEYEFPFKEHTFRMPDGGEINAVHFEVPNTKGVVYYLKGNSRSIKGWGKFARDFLGKGYDFFMIDYRGFGKSTGRRTEKRLYEDSLFVYDWLAERYNPSDILIYGRSFGTGLAAYVAAKRTSRMLILEAPYYSFLYQIRRFARWLPLQWLLKYKIPTFEFMRAIDRPIFIIHGDRDFIISYEQGSKLAEINPAHTTLITIHGGRHNDLPSFPDYHRKLYDIIR